MNLQDLWQQIGKIVCMLRCAAPLQSFSKSRSYKYCAALPLKDLPVFKAAADPQK